MGLRGGKVYIDRLHAYDLPTPDLGSCISGGLGREIILALMHDNDSPNHFLNGEPIRKHRHIRQSVIAHQRRQVSRVVGMGTIGGIVVRPGIAEWVIFCAGTTSAFVDMERKNPIVAS